MSIKDKLDLLESKLQGGKSKLATAITEKGVTTSNSATLETMASNISKIQQSSGGSSEVPISELVLPMPKLLKTIDGNPHYFKYYYDEQGSYEYYLFPDGFMNAVKLYDNNFSEYGAIRKVNGGYEVIEKFEFVSYDIDNNDYAAIFAVDNNYNLYAGYSYMNYISGDQFKYADAETNNTGLSNLANIKNIFGINKIGIALATDDTGKGYFIFPLGNSEYSSGYVYKAIDDLVGETVDFTNLNNSYENNSGEIQADFNPVQFIESENQIILVNDTNIYRFDYSILGEYQTSNYENHIVYRDKITCNDTIHSYGIDYPYMYASNRYSNNYVVDLSNHFGNMTSLSGMYGNNLRYTKIQDKMYSLRSSYLYLLENGNKTQTKYNDGTNSIKNAIKYALGDGENTWFFVDAYEIIISKFVTDKFKHYISIANSSGFTFNSNVLIDKDGNLLILNSGSLYKLEKDPKVTI